MAKYLAIEWDSSELRMALGRNRGSGIAIDETYAVSLPEDASPEIIGQAIRDTIGSEAKGVETLIAIPRAAVEIRQLQLPAAPQDEMPDMVRFQAMRQFTTIGDDWPLDFVELDRSDSDVQVLASVISPESFKEIQQVCQASNRVAEHLCLRPFASAELLKEHLGNDTSCRLIADVMAGSADLGVLVNGQIAFMRTIRLPAVPDDADLPIQGLMGEIRRTIAAASNQLSGQAVTAVTLFGTGSRLEPLRSAIETQLKLDAGIWNPFTNARLGSSPPSHPGRYAALLGMILNQSTGVRQPIDFLNPRRRPKPKSNRERYLLYTFLTVAVVAVLAVGAFMMLQQKTRTLAKLTQEKEDSKKKVEHALAIQGKLAQVEAFRDESVNFVEELGTISRAMPGPDDARVQKLIGTLNQGKALITMDVKVSGYEHISNIENSLQGDDREVNGKRSREGVGDDEFPWSFQALTSIDPVVKRVIAEKLAEAAKSASEAGLDIKESDDKAESADEDTDRDARRRSNGAADDGAADDGEAGDGEAGEGEAGDGEAGDGEAGDGEAGEGEAGDGEAGEGEAGEGEAGEGEAGDGEAGDGEAGDGEAGDGEAGDGEAGDGEAGDGEAGDGEAGDGEAGDGEAGDGEAGDGDKDDDKTNITSESDPASELAGTENGS